MGVERQPNYEPGKAKRHGPRQVCQGEIARRADLHPSTVSKVLSSGRGKLRTIRAIAKVIGMSLDDFVKLYSGEEAA